MSIFKRKQCKHCARKHSHNNDWCSVDCCKADREANGDTIGTSLQRKIYKRKLKFGRLFPNLAS